MTIREIAVAYGYEIDKNSEKQAESSIKGIKNLANKLLGALSVVFTISGLSELAQAAADAEALKSQFKQVFGEMEDEATKSLQAIADESGALVSRMKGSFTQIAAFTKTTGATEAESLEIAERGMYAVADSAAFYDRSLEDVTASLQSFLKGNFENDAALGLSCTEITRNAAANELYGKSFKDLSEYQKQLTLLKMVEDANKASGALGQAARESDTWTNQLGNLKQSLTDLKAAAGSTFLKPAVAVLKLLTALVQKATKAVQSLTAENGLLTIATERYHALVKRLQPAIDRMASTLSKGMERGKEVVKGVVDKLGGIENTLKIAAIAVAAFVIAMNWSKIISGVKTFLKMISSIGKIFSLANLKIMAVVAVVVMLALVVEDFINFLMGNDSVIGTIFDKAGIGADNARQAITDAWNNVVGFLQSVWGTIQEAAGMFVGTIVGFFSRHASSIQGIFKRAWGIIQTFLGGVWEFISSIAGKLFGETEESINGSTQNTQDGVLGVWQNILDTLSEVLDALFEVFETVFDAVATVVETVFGWIESFWNTWGDKILNLFSVLFDSIGGILNGFLDVIKGVANFISSVFTGDWQGAWEAIQQIFSGIWDIIVNFITGVWETIKLLFEMALSAIAAVWDSVWGAISSFFIGIWDGIVSFLQGIWETILSVISGAITGAYDTVVSVLTSIWDFFSSTFTGISDTVSSVFDNILSGITSTVGNIKDAIVGGFDEAVSFITSLPEKAIQWGSDFIGGLKDGIMSGIQGIVDAVKGVGEKIKSFLHFSVPDEGPLTDYESWMPDFMHGLATGISENEGEVLDKVKNLAGGIQTLMSAATANAATATTSTVNNTTSSITQNVNIANSYTGGSAETQKNVSKAMKKSAVDATTQMARSLAYARG